MLMSGPAGTGKSRACLEKLLLVMLKYPGAKGLIVRKTQVSLGSTALETWRKHVIPEYLATGSISFYGGSAEQPPQYRFENGSTVMIGGMDNSTKIMSSDYDLAYAQEAIELTESDWEAITTRLRNGMVPYQQLIADTNPSVPTHWLKKRCDRGDCQLLASKHTDNPVLFDESGRLTDRGKRYMGTLDKLTGPRKFRLRDGLWVAAEGQVYDGWDSAVHLIDRFPIPASWQRFWSVDFGFTNPFVWQDWACDPDGRLYLVQEIYRTRRLVEDHALEIMNCVSTVVATGRTPDGHRVRAYEGRTWTVPRPSRILCDHDAEGRATLETELGLSTTAANKAVLEGIQFVQSRLKIQGDGKPRLFVFRDALRHEPDPYLSEKNLPVQTADEFGGYVWKRRRDRDQGELDEPIKENDHGMDTTRYVVMDRDRSTSGGIRWM